MTATSTAMQDIYSGLKKIGIAESFARKALPIWWDDAITDAASGIQQAQLYLSRAFNLDPASLINTTEAPRFCAVGHKFKLNKNVTEDQVSVSAHYATAMARIALQGVNIPYVAMPDSPNELRARILQKYPCVNLDALLAYCREAGVPVLHIASMPGRKMTGLAIRLDGRFAIVLSKKGHPAILLFHLAHELGHIAKKHLIRDGFLADQKIGENNRDDADEIEADAYAICLLNGAEIRYEAAGQITSGNQLFNAATLKAKETQVDVGHIIMNYGHTQKHFGLAHAALRDVSGPKDGAMVVNSALFQTLSSERLSEDQMQLLHTATGFSAA